MKINIDDNNYISISQNGNGHVNLSVKARKDDNNYILISLSLDEDDLNDLISELVSLRARLK